MAPFGGQHQRRSPGHVRALQDPYPGKLGVIEAGEYVDLLLFDGDPMTDIDLCADPAGKLLVVMEVGAIHKRMPV